MAQTLRDRTWNTALELLTDREKFKVHHIMAENGLKDGQHQTVRRTLRALEEMDWVERESQQSSIWRLGWKGRLLLDASEETLEQARQ